MEENTPKMEENVPVMEENNPIPEEIDLTQEDYNTVSDEFKPEQEPQQYEYAPQVPRKKKSGTGKLVALVAVVALVSAVAGAALTYGIDYLRQSREENSNLQQDTSEQQDEKAYDLVEHSLPEALPTNEADKGLSPAQVYELTVHSVVGISTESKVNAFGQEAVQASTGSGFILTEDGYIITNHHVIKDADRVEVKLFDGESYKAEVVDSDSSYDIAVLKIEAEGLPAVTVGDSDKLRVGEEVIAIGNPLGELTFTMTYGILSALDREINTDGNPQNMLQTDVAINSGNSGGPLFDMNGNVIGVTSAKYTGTTASGTVIEGLGFAIPINDALKVAYDLVDYGYVRGQAYLGVTIQSLDDRTAAYYGLPMGPRVSEVVPGSCAEKAGVQIGDVIIALNDIETENHTALKAALKKFKAGDTVELKMLRAGWEVKVSVTLDEKPRTPEE